MRLADLSDTILLYWGWTKAPSTQVWLKLVQ